MKVKINEIITGDRIMDLEKLIVDNLKESIKVNGLINPIVITKENKLIGGLHRLTACKELGHTEIEAVYYEDSTDVNNVLAEIDENLVRKDLHWLERAEQVVTKVYVKYYDRYKESELSNILQIVPHGRTIWDKLTNFIDRDKYIDSNLYEGTPNQTFSNYRKWIHFLNQNEITQQIKDIAIKMNAPRESINFIMNTEILRDSNGLSMILQELKQVVKEFDVKNNIENEKLTKDIASKKFFSVIHEVHNTLDKLKREKEQYERIQEMKRIQEEKEKKILENMKDEDKIKRAIEDKVTQQEHRYRAIKNTFPEIRAIETKVLEKIEAIKPQIKSTEELVEKIKTLEINHETPKTPISEDEKPKQKIEKSPHTAMVTYDYRSRGLIAEGYYVFFVNDSEDAGSAYASELLDKKEKVLFICRYEQDVKTMIKIIKSKKKMEE